MENAKETGLRYLSQIKPIKPPFNEVRARKVVKEHDGRAAYVKQFHHPCYNLGILRFDEKSHDCFYFTRIVEGQRARTETRIAYDDLEGMLVETSTVEALQEERHEFPEESNYP